MSRGILSIYYSIKNHIRELKRTREKERVKKKKMREWKIKNKIPLIYWKVFQSENEKAWEKKIE